MTTFEELKSVKISSVTPLEMHQYQVTYEDLTVARLQVISIETATERVGSLAKAIEIKDAELVVLKLEKAKLPKP